MKKISWVSTIVVIVFAALVAGGLSVVLWPTETRTGSLAPDYDNSCIRGDIDTTRFLWSPCEGCSAFKDCEPISSNPYEWKYKWQYSILFCKNGHSCRCEGLNCVDNSNVSMPQINADNSGPSRSLSQIDATGSLQEAFNPIPDQAAVVSNPHDYPVMCLVGDFSGWRATENCVPLGEGNGSWRWKDVNVSSRGSEPNRFSLILVPAHGGPPQWLEPGSVIASGRVAYSPAFGLYLE